MFTAGETSIPTTDTFVAGAGFASAVTVVSSLGGRVLNQSIDNAGGIARCLWFAVRSLDLQPTVFKAGTSAVLAGDVTPVKPPNIILVPTTGTGDYAGESYNLYGITLQPGSTYLNIS